jgi:hypothetical protein
MKRIILATLVLAVSALAQAPKERFTKLVTLKYADPNAIVSMIRAFGVDVQLNGAMKTMSISGLPDNITAAEAAIKQLDVAPKNIELVVHFLVGSNLASATGAVPAELKDVVAQLKSTFTFKEYNMLDTLTLRTRAGSSADTTGVVSPAGVNPPRMTQFSIRNASVSEDGVIRIDRMHAGLRIPVPGQQKVDYVNTGIDQDIDVKEGQKVVVGRASLEGPEKALFLILTAKVVQ